MSNKKTFDIWVEGFAATGQSGDAYMIGQGHGVTFDEAVEQFLSINLTSGIEKNTRSMYISEEAYNNRRSNWNIWACNLFDNEEDARKEFG